MTGVARTRIGRITLKSGGSMHVLPRVEQNDVSHHMRDWLTITLDNDRPPDAYAAVAFHCNPDQPGNPHISIGYASVHDALPLAQLVRVAASALIHDFAAESGKRRALRAYGDEPPSWTPDPAA
jgi:hypothetical protein